MEREGLPLPSSQATGQTSTGWQQHAQGVSKVVHTMIALASNATKAQGEGQLTPQQVTEMWQPLAIELKRDTFVSIISLSISLLKGDRGRREIVSAAATLRVLTIHLQFFERCNIDVSSMLRPLSASACAEHNDLRSQLLERFFSVLLLPVMQIDPQLQGLWAAMQAEVVFALIAGMRYFFPTRHATTLLLHASLTKEKQAAARGEASPLFTAYISALCQWLASQRHVSHLISISSRSEERHIGIEGLRELLPSSLDAPPLPLHDIQHTLWQWLLDESARHVRSNLSRPTSGELPADTLKLLCAATQEMMALASLCNERDGLENVQLLRMAEKLMKGATAIFEALPTPNGPGLSLLQAQLAPTFIGSLLPWLVDALCLYSAFTFDFSQKLLPLVLPLLEHLKRLLSADPSLRRFEMANAPTQTAQPVVISSSHPYKPAGPQPAARASKDRRPKPANRSEEKHEWPGASQLLLRFDRRCCTEDGDWLTLNFFKGRAAKPIKSVRVGGQWQQWPKQLSVQADSLHAVFVHGAEAQPSDQPRTSETFGYHFTVTASKRWTADKVDTPPLVQLRSSLFYLGTKCACLLCSAEPVEAEERENKHWLHSPLFARGLPLQLDSKHPLMHPFYGIKNVQNGRESPGRGAAFLADLVDTALEFDDSFQPTKGACAASMIHAYMLRSSPELSQRTLLQPQCEMAARALVASLLSYNGSVQDAQDAAAVLSANVDHVQSALSMETNGDPSADVSWEEGRGEASTVNWSKLRQQWIDAYNVFKDMHEAYCRSLSEDSRVADAGEGLLKLARFVLLAAQQHDGTSRAGNATESEDLDFQQLGATLGTDVRRLFVKGRHSGEGSSTIERRVEQDVVELVASRASTTQLRQLVVLQQKRAYSRAAGYHAACQLLRVSEGNPRLQSKVLSELVAVLRPTAVDDASDNSSLLTRHYSRDLDAAGPHACGRLRLAFAALLGQLGRLINLDFREAALETRGPSSSVSVQIHQIWAMRCLLHTELRKEDLLIQQEVGLLPMLHSAVAKLHGWRTGADVASSDDASSASTDVIQPEMHHRSLSHSVDTVDSKQLPRTVQLLYHALVSRFCLLNSSADGALRKGSSGAPSSQRRRLSAPPFASEGSCMSEVEGVVVSSLLRALTDVAVRMREVLEAAHATLLGADTRSGTWQTMERFLHGSLAQLFQFIVGRPDVASSLAVESALRTLFGVLHVSSLRCARLALRCLRLLLPQRSFLDLPASLFGPPESHDARGGLSRQASSAKRSSGILSYLASWSPADLSGHADEAAESAESFLSAVENVPPLIAFLLMIVADQFVEASPNIPLTLLCCRSLWRSSQVRCAFAAEVVLLLRHLAQCSAYEAPLRQALRESLVPLPGVALSLQEDPTAGQLAHSNLVVVAKLAFGSLSVLGGSLPSLFVGCRVGVETATAEDSTGEVRQEGILVRWDGAADSAAHVLLDSQVSELRLISVSALQLLPLDESELPVGMFPLEPSLVPCFAAFLPKTGPKAAIPSALQSSLLFGLLQARALKSLQRLLTHPSSMRVALAGGLLPGIMASAATPIPLLGMHHTEVLQMRLTQLEQIHIEASTAARMAKEHVISSRQARAQRPSASASRLSALSSEAESTNLERFRDRVELLVQMGFEVTLCQKAVGQFGDDMDASVTWLTDEQQQQAERTKLHRSPSWQMADDLAAAMGFSAAACKKALEKTRNRPNAAANWLLEHAAEIVADEEDDGGVDSAEGGAGGDDQLNSIDAESIRTVSFRPGAALALQNVGLGVATGSELQRSDRAESFLQSNSVELTSSPLDAFMSASPLPPPPLPGESSIDVAGREASAPLLLSRIKETASTTALHPLEPRDCLPGRLLRPTPLPANLNCVVGRFDDATLFVELLTRLSETDVLVPTARALTHCQRAEASLATQFPELRRLGANSSGLDAVAGMAHTALAIMLLRQAVVYLLADLQGLQSSHEDSDSVFDLSQLGQPRDLLDLLKLAYHSSGGGNTSKSSSFGKLWGLIDALMRADGEAVHLPTPFKTLPRLLRDDALLHLRRELRGSATCQSPHPLITGNIAHVYALRLPNASQITVHLDRRTQLGGTAEMIFAQDEAGENVVARWQGETNGWSNVTVVGDCLWVHIVGEVSKKELAKRPWGFSVRITASRWVPPEHEVNALDAPLAIGWQLLELLSEHRPLELLTTHTYRTLVHYLHTADAPHRVLAAALLLRLLGLPKHSLPSEMTSDPRDAWSMEPLLSLAPHVEWHRANCSDPVSGLLPPHVQLCAELVARAWQRCDVHTRASQTRPSEWTDKLIAMCDAVQYLLQVTHTGSGERLKPPQAWVELIAQQGLPVEELDVGSWPLSKLAALVKMGVAEAKAAKVTTAMLNPIALPDDLGRAGPLAGMTKRGAMPRFALLVLLNQALDENLSLVFTGYADQGHTLGAQLCALRELIFPEVKGAAWARALDATALIQDVQWRKDHPPPAVTVNRHRAAKERSDRRLRMRHTVFSQLYAQLQFVDVGLLKRRDRAFKVRFAGEGADDHGGPYREVFTMMCGELENTKAALQLLLLSPNGQHSHGSNRDRFVMNPAATTPEELHWYEFLGQLTAIALLQKETVLSLNLCSVVWKQLVQETADASDLAAFDQMVCQSLHKIKHIDEEGIDESLFGELIFETFTTQLSNGTHVELCDSGAEIDVTWANRARYCELVMRARLRESRAQVHAMLRGISTMLPVRLLPLFTHSELELMTCGAPDIDIPTLRRHTRYGVSVNMRDGKPVDAHVHMLWQVLDSFTPELRSKFLTFIWGRNRLPSDEEWGEQSMKIHTLEAVPADAHFPVTHTCFFSIEWPRYSSFEVARAKLLYAILHCTDMDMDTTAEGLRNRDQGFEDAEG